MVMRCVAGGITGSITRDRKAAMEASEFNGCDEESDSDSQASPPTGPTGPSFMPPRIIPPSDPPFEPRQPVRRPLNPDYEEDEF